MAIDLTSTLSGVRDTLRSLKPKYEGAVLVLLNKSQATAQWERVATLTRGWDHTTIRLAQESPRLEVLIIYGDAAPAAVINGVWPAFDIIWGDGSGFQRFTKMSKVPVSGFADKYVFQVRPNDQDATPTPA